MSFIARLRRAAKPVVQECQNIWSALHTLKPMHRAFFYGAISAFAIGFYLQQQAFPPSAASPFSQVSASVYTRFNPSRVLLQVMIEPNASQNDRLNITVKGPHGERDPWLLVITCPRRVPGRVDMELAGVTPPQSVQVLVSVYDVGYRSVPLPCVGAPPGRSGAATPVVLAGENINFSLPALELGPVGLSAAADTPVYVMRGTLAGHRIEKVVEFFQAPDSSCPVPGASPAPAASASAATASASAASRPAGGPAVTANAACYTQLPAGTAATKYSFPASVTTSEALEQLSLSGDRIDSMFPPGQITTDGKVIWQAASGLSPSLSASSVAGAVNASKDGFFAGLFYGFAAGLIIPFLQAVSESHDRIREAQRTREGPANSRGERGMASAQLITDPWEHLRRAGESGRGPPR